ncbi:MAG: hypothetical protein IPJ03_06215 [Ignavibacteriales bacterium]|nr:hypothetical protein [Ignavibacteriales bacterium]
MELILPTEEEIKLSIAELFDKVFQNEKGWLLSALVPIDLKLTNVGKVITFVIEDEMRELCNFLNSFNEQKKNTDDIFQKKRIQILIYCHIMEADFPYTVIWNLLRVLNKQKCLWTFYACDENGEPKKDKNNKFPVLRYSLEKINAIKKLSNIHSLTIGDTLSKIWQSNIRNAFSHSQYFWIGNTFRVSNTISPLSRRDEDIDKTIFYTEEQINKLYDIASVYLLTFIEAYKFAVNTYKDGKPYKVHDGVIKWTKYNWRWAN